MNDRDRSPRMARALFRMARPFYPRALLATWAEMEDEFVHDVRRARARGILSVCQLLLVRLPADIVRAHRMCSGELSLGANRTGVVRALRDDFRFALRLLRRTPGFSMIAIGTVALGVAGVSTVYSVARGVWLERLPYNDPARLVAVWSVDRTTGLRDQFSIPEYMDYAERARTLAVVGAYDIGPVTLTGGDVMPRRLRLAALSHSTLRILGVRAAVGRVWRAEEDVRDGPNLVVVSHDFWRNQLQSDSTLRATLMLDGTSHEVIGVMPAEFAFPAAEVKLWRPLQEDREAFSRRGRYVSMVARMADGVRLPAVKEELREIATQLEVAMPRYNSGITATAGPLRSELVGGAVPVLLMLGGGVAILFLLACGNVAHLLLVRAMRREREITLRTALGAGRGRLMSQLMTETVTLFAIGGAVGAALAAAAVRAIVASDFVVAFRMEQVSVDVPAVAFTIALALSTGLLFGLVPATYARRSDLTRALRARSEARGRDRFSDLVVIAQMGLAVVLFTGSMLLTRTVRQLDKIDPGFRYEELIKADLQLPDTKYPTSMSAYPNWPEIQNFYDELLTQVRSVPGIVSAGLGWNHPLERWGGLMRFSFDAAVEDGGEELAHLVGVTPEFFETVGIRLVAGRTLRYEDEQTSPPVAVVNQSFVDRFGSREPTIGRRMTVLGRSFEIVGVVSDIRTEGINVAPTPVIYPPLAQLPSEWISLVARVSPGPTESVFTALRTAIWDVEPDVPLDGLEALTSVRDRQLRAPQLRAAVVAMLAATAGLLAAVGLAGVLGYAVQRRHREIGIRMALGADRVRVVRNTVSRGLVVAGIGVMAGMIPAMAAAQMWRVFLYDVGPWDPVSLVAAPLVLLAVAGVAATFPAMRASAIHPVKALS